MEVIQSMSGNPSGNCPEIDSQDLDISSFDADQHPDKQKAVQAENKKVQGKPRNQGAEQEDESSTKRHRLELQQQRRELQMGKTPQKRRPQNFDAPARRPSFPPPSPQRARRPDSESGRQGSVSSNISQNRQDFRRRGGPHSQRVIEAGPVCRSQTELSVRDNKQTNNTIFLSNIPFYLQQHKKIASFFSQYGGIARIVIKGSYAQVQFASREGYEKYFSKKVIPLNLKFVRANKKPDEPVCQADIMPRIQAEYKYLKKEPPKQIDDMHRSIGPCYRFLLFLKKNIDCFEDIENFDETVQKDLETCMNIMAWLENETIILEDEIAEVGCFIKEIKSLYSMTLYFDEDVDKDKPFFVRQKIIREELTKLLGVDSQALNITIKKKQPGDNKSSASGSAERDDIAVTCLSGIHMLRVYLYIKNDISFKKRKLKESSVTFYLGKIADKKEGAYISEINKALEKNHPLAFMKFRLQKHKQARQKKEAEEAKIKQEQEANEQVESVAPLPIESVAPEQPQSNPYVQQKDIEIIESKGDSEKIQTAKQKPSPKVKQEEPDSNE